MSAYFGTDEVKIYTKNYSILNCCPPDVEPDVMVQLSDDTLLFKDHEEKFIVNKEFIKEHNEMKEQLKNINLFMENLKDFFQLEKEFKKMEIL